jgi:hypothetical protein
MTVLAQPCAVSARSAPSAREGSSCVLDFGMRGIPQDLQEVLAETSVALQDPTPRLFLTSGRVVCRKLACIR